VAHGQDAPTDPDLAALLGPALEHAARDLAVAARVAVLTGAGISRESGLATFREPGGVWARYDMADVASRAGFERDPEGVWQWYARRRAEMALARPNAAHLALATLEAAGKRVAVITQNIDCLHTRAGSTRVIELHGNVAGLECFDERVPVREAAPGDQIPPRCPNCGGRLRPAVVWFGEPIPSEALETAWREAERCDVFLSVGTAAEVQPAASLPLVARESGARVIEVNPAETAVTRMAHHVLAGPAGVVLPALVERAMGGLAEADREGDTGS
jgi:NAD-dependent deacetylase